MTEFLLALNNVGLVFICLWPVLVPLIVLLIVFVIFDLPLTCASATERSL